MEKPNWYVFVEKNGKIREWNVFDHYGFYEDFKKWLDECDTIQEFAEEIERETRYYFWSRCEYEVVMSDMFDRAERKVDVYTQLIANWDRFVEYSWTFKI